MLMDKLEEDAKAGIADLEQQVEVLVKKNEQLSSDFASTGKV